MRQQLSTIGQRIERTRAGEWTISGVVVLVLLISVVWCLPDAEVKRRLTPALQPVAVATGLEQYWRMYAPEPLRRLEFVEVRVTMADGVQRVWTDPRGDRVVGAFAWYHWQKLKENVVREPPLRVGLAHWVVGRLTARSERAARVQIILRTEVLSPPGAENPRTVGEETLYDEALTGGR